jgi:aminoglycoside 6'-N-acetyltransferase I
MAPPTPEITVRPPRAADAPALASLCFALWPESPLKEHAMETESKLAGEARTTMPLAFFVAEAPDRTLVGFVEVGLRSHADGCDPAQPVGFLEGWYVTPQFRCQGIGRLLISAAEDWARERGCREMASDTWIDHDLSQQAHVALGYLVVDRCVHYRKSL